MLRKLFTLLGTIGIFVGGFVLIGVMGSLRPKIEPKEVELAPPAVFYATVDPKPTTLNVFAQGEVRPRTDINLTAEVSGRIVRTSNVFVAGGAFRKGDLLVKIEDADYRVAVAAAKARMAQSEEGLRREEAEADLALKDYEALGRAEEASELTLRKPQLAQARAAFDAARADYNGALLNLQRTELRAPFDGRVRERLAGEGQFIAPGAAIGRIFSTDVAEIRLPLADSDLAKLGISLAFVETKESPGPKVTLSATIAGTLEEWPARIARTDGAIDPATRQISAIAVVDDPYGAGAGKGAPLAMGLFVDALIEGRALDRAVVLPRTALFGRNTVFVIGAESRISAREVVVLAADRDTITISGGLEAGERVVTSPLRGAKDGDKVTPTDATAIPGADRGEEEEKTVAEAVRRSVTE
ncbi:MAG TPA: efflux RND transporter periplasmic adaptor subunit [Parvularcula sp.]|nr:efflux RND transporter periplasmic adaptor subunit [Parvularcula sp.]HBS33229.1 efflux RND transporter periplasmic adaptor subunit [Parvularcula sp.]HBS35607.1 efflux RND transporter periplasmic adaptor subunit [Parvularcula sp.]